MLRAQTRCMPSTGKDGQARARQASLPDTSVGVRPSMRDQGVTVESAPRALRMAAFKSNACLSGLACRKPVAFKVTL